MYTLYYKQDLQNSVIKFELLTIRTLMDNIELDIRLYISYIGI